MNLTIDTLHGFLVNPHELDKENFQKLIFFLGISKIKKIMDRIITDDSGQIGNLFDLLVNIKFLPSKSEVIRLIKNNGLTINKTKVGLNTKIDKSMFLFSGASINDAPLFFLVVRKGKNDCDLILAL